MTRLLNFIIGLLFLSVLIMAMLLERGIAEEPAIVTFYSSGTIKGLVLGTGTKSAWHGGKLYDGEQRITGTKGMTNHRFLTMRMKPGTHHLAGETWRGNKPSTEKSILNFVPGQKYFVKLTTVHKGWGVYGTFHYFAEIVSCEQAYAEAATASPVQPKHIDRAAIGDVEPLYYFPKCD